MKDGGSGAPKHQAKKKRVTTKYLIRTGGREGKNKVHRESGHCTTATVLRYDVHCGPCGGLCTTPLFGLWAANRVHPYTDKPVRCAHTL